MLPLGDGTLNTAIPIVSGGGNWFFPYAAR